KQSRFARKASRDARPKGGRRIAGKGEPTEDLVAPPAVAAELPGPPPELAPELTPESDPLSRPLLDADPFGIRAALTATKTTPSGAPEPEDIPVVFKPTPQPEPIPEPSPEPRPEPSPTPAPEQTLPRPAATN